MMQPSQVAELKQRGAIEAAQDAGSKVTAEDAEKKIAEETAKAGDQLYQFDPDASPEAKAAQARAHLPPGFNHQKEPLGVALATDINNGAPDQYELPPPSKAGAISATKSQKENDLMANGVIPEDENARWVERTGWAPRFGQGVVPEGDGETMLDHETWLESRLEDKFFGDWYQNTAVIIFACLASWTVATLGGGLAWVMIVMSICGVYYRTSLRRVRRNFRDDVTREMAKQRLETDNEPLEWINSFLVKFWPIYQPVLADTIIKSVDQVLSTTTPAFLDSLRLKKFTLGSKPPRLEHVKTYPKAEDDIVLMDWKFSFTPNDIMDLTARQLKNKVNPKIILEIRIGKAMISKGLDVIVQDMAFSGLMRVKVKLQIPFPHVDRIDICFLERPTIDYVCKPLGGDTFGFDITSFVPFLQDFIMEQIHANLGPIFYAPNVFPIEVAKILAGNPVDQAIGVLAVTLHGARDLKNSDKFSGTPDPYAIYSLNSRSELARTQIIPENPNPRWNDTKHLIITSLQDNLTIQVFDFNDIRKDKELGTATFALDQIQTAAEHLNLNLEVMANGKPRGAVQADVRFFPVLEGRKLEDGKMEPPPESNTGIVKFTVEAAKDLDGTKSLIGQLNPYALLLLNGKEVHATRKLKRTNNPIWDNGSKEIFITDKKSARLGLVIKDEREIGTNPVLGTYQIKLEDMLTTTANGQDWYNLAGTKEGRAKMTVQWKPVALKGGLGGIGGYVTPIGVMRLHFQNARDLRNLETVGKSDPYVRVLLSGVEKGRTVTFKNNLNPDWDEVLYVPMHSTREKLTLEVMDQESLGKDRPLGATEILASQYIQEGENGEFAVNDTRRVLSDPLKLFGKGTSKGVLNYTVSFFPCFNIVDPEEEEEEEKRLKEEKAAHTAVNGAEEADKKGSVELENEKLKAKVDTELVKQLAEGEKEQGDIPAEKKPPKLRLPLEELVKHESGLLIFKLIDGELSQSNCQIEVVMDDMAFPSYISSKSKTKTVEFNEVGDAFVRELDFSKITLRVREKTDTKGDEKKDNTLAKLTGHTMDTLKLCYNKPTVLTLKDTEGGTSRVKVSLKYIPVRMTLDPSESINNMGNLRVDILKAEDLPSADRNGFSDPYCKFELNGKDVHKTKKKDKTLNPVWNEFFEVPIPSRTASAFKVKVYDWDFGENPDFLGAADINLEQIEPFQRKDFKLRLDGKSGTVFIRMLFTPDYVTRSRQGSSTFSGTFNNSAPGKIVSGVASAPLKGVGLVGGGVMKGASFIRHGFKSKKKTEDANGSIDTDETAPSSVQDSPSRNSSVEDEATPGLSPTVPVASPNHSRSRSFGAQSIASVGGGKPTAVDLGTASFTIISATGYPDGANVRVHLKQVSTKGEKDVHKTKAIKSHATGVQWDHEVVKLSCSADTQFKIQVKDHSTFGSDDDLGEGLLFVDDSGTNTDKAIKAGSGTVMIRSSFAHADSGSVTSSPRSNGVRRSLLSRGKDTKERSVTPT
ncbi:MAG: hypothetical protein M1829_001061 [Trizodia sp. TS-e1964]|nr:MAG: hypothetical protein M1829_001061 [Trizodia sp. TS-e1964]